MFLSRQATGLIWRPIEYYEISLSKVFGLMCFTQIDFTLKNERSLNRKSVDFDGFRCKKENVNSREPFYFFNSVKNVQSWTHIPQGVKKAF